ncbi:hypothetical protein MMRN_31780 [Mycobacterium marinum]|nr:hypothetical protein MMRN_31780 [Mycobacterium marinum]
MTGPPAIIGATVVTPPVMSLVGGATGGGLVGAAPRPASGTWVKPAPVAGTVEGMSGAAGERSSGRGSVAAVIAPADMEFAPAAAGAPVDIPFVKTVPGTVAIKGSRRRRCRDAGD